MDIQTLKNYIIENDCIEKILESLNLDNIKSHDGYYTCSNQGGDNKKGIIVYKDSLVLKTTTRVSKNTDLISLVMQIKELSCGYAVKYICGILELDYYYNPDKDKPEILKHLEMLEGLKKGYEKEDTLIPLTEDTLGKYLHYPNTKWLEEGISVKTQTLFKIGFSLFDKVITIPIYDDIDNLVGIKCRKWDSDNSDDYKYFALYSYPKTQILYGLNQTYDLIKKQGFVVVVESEKSVLKLFDKNIGSVAIAGHCLSESQINKLERLNVPTVLCYDEGVSEEEIQIEIKKFLSFSDVSVMFDKNKILKLKESPADDFEKFKILFSERSKDATKL